MGYRDICEEEVDRLLVEMLRKMSPAQLAKACEAVAKCCENIETSDEVILHGESPQIFSEAPISCQVARI